MPRPTAEPKDFISLLEPEPELEEYTLLPEQELDKDKTSLVAKDIDLAGLLSQLFAAYGFNPFEPRTTDKDKTFISFPFPPQPSTSTILLKKLANDDVTVVDGTKDIKIKMNMPCAVYRHTRIIEEVYAEFQNLPPDK